MSILSRSFSCLFILSSFLFANDISCPFCNKNIIESQIIFETTYHNIILDYAPLVRGHLLVIPKRHIAKAHELTKEEWAELGDIIPKVVKIFKLALNTDQYLIFEKNGPKAFQSVPHVHFHLLPIQNQTWQEIFLKMPPPKLTEEELKKEVNEFRNYYLKI